MKARYRKHDNEHPDPHIDIYIETGKNLIWMPPTPLVELHTPHQVGNMSNSTKSSGTTGAGESAVIPRAIVHKKILTEAERHPEATMTELASRVNGANTDMVERILEQFGDPASDDELGIEKTEGDDECNSGGVQSGTRGQDSNQPSILGVDPSQLTQRRREILRLVHENPKASQRDIAEMSGTSQSAICQRINSIDGFEWENRKEILETMVENDVLETNGKEGSGRSQQERGSRIEDLERQLRELRDQCDGRAVASGSVFIDPELVSKIVHACMDSEQITEEEELKILREILGS